MIVEPVDDSNQKLPFIDAVQRLGVSYHFEKEIEDDNDLYTTALRFRLLREHGSDVSCASYMRIHGENILDEAISFTTAHLTLALPTLDHPFPELVDHALKQSVQRGLPRARLGNSLLQFAKIDFNLLQFVHRKELSEIRM
ncbi:hypothetical protein V6N12_032463 [Hibiscus sabdariffa]|uniref:Terpene synthase N-terminal domain-containing protein n=1 Tax=Hibiscus sabdariffa TaxID=183260 RepID=A0ABR2CCN1_9ROSI